MAHLVGYGVYLPRWRLHSDAVVDSLGTVGARGTRAVASFDEDSTSMGVEAARMALRSVPADLELDALTFATTSPAYLDKTNATAIHAALGLPGSTGAYDVGGSARSAAAAVRAAEASSETTAVVCSEVRTGLPGSTDEAAGGDAAVCLVFSESGPPLLERLGRGTTSAEFLDRWQTVGAQGSKVWEERFGESVYLPLAQAAFDDALKDADLSVGQVDRLIVAGLHGRACRAFAAASGVDRDRVAGNLVTQVGNPGVAQPGLLLADALDQAEVGDVIAVVHLADGADATVYRVGSGLPASRDGRETVRSQVGRGRPVPYASFLSWRGMLRREPPRRPDFDAPAAPPSARREPWKFSLTGSRCEACGTRSLPPGRVCASCRTADRMVPEPMADGVATIATFTIDRLAYTPSPPLIATVVDFDGGGRIAVELADASPDEVAIGQRVSMTFRRLYTAPNGVHNYFWKARLVQEDDHS